MAHRRFYQEHYQKVVNIPEEFNSYATRVFDRLFYWLGIVDIRLNREVSPPFEEEYKKTDLLSMIFWVNVKRRLLKSGEIWITLWHEEMAGIKNDISGGNNGKL